VGCLDPSATENWQSNEPLAKSAVEADFLTVS